MRLLLDSHAVLWYFHAPTRMSAAAIAAIESGETQPLISSASFWEIAIKAGLGKLTLSEPLSDIRDAFVSHGARVLDVTSDHAIAVQNLPQHHRDPFDRLLAVQALAEDLTVVSRDAVFDLYGVSRIW